MALSEEELRQRWAQTIPLSQQDSASPLQTWRGPPRAALHATILEAGVANTPTAETIVGAGGPSALAETIVGASPHHQATVDPGADTIIGAGPTPPVKLETERGFEVLGEIGRGGMGVVSRALQRSLGRQVAIKRVLGGPDADELRSRFVSEALVTGQLDHPNIVPLYDLVEGGGDIFIAMKLVDGKCWRDLIHPESGEAAPLDEHLRILGAVSQAIAFAHSRGVAHLDLKPENVMVGGFGEVFVMDWGLAVDVSDAASSADRSGPGASTLHKSQLRQPCGTPAYMPPELAEGHGERVGPWTDVYLLGAILYEVATGAPPHKGDTLIQVLKSAALGKAPCFNTHPDVDPGLRRICRRALAAEPEDRYATVEAFQEDLAAVLRHRESRALERLARERLEALPERFAGGEGRSRLYARFAEAVAGFHQALELWEGNPEAREGERTARRRYAELALSAGDLGLVEAQLESLVEQGEAAEDLAGRLAEAREASARRARSARRLKWGAAASLAATVAALAVGAVIAERGRMEAEQAREQAELARAQADEAAELARRAKEEADRQAARARAELAAGKLGEGHSLILAGRWREAEARVTRADEMVRAEGLDPLPATVGLWRTGAHLPPPLFTAPEGESETGIIRLLRADPTRDRVFTAHSHGRVGIRGLPGGELIADPGGLPAPIDALAVSPDGRWLAMGTRATSENLRVYELEGSGKVLFADLEGVSVQALCFGPGARWLTIGGGDGRIYSLDLPFETPRPFSHGTYGTSYVSLGRGGNWSGILDLAASPDERLLAVAAATHQLTLLDARSGAVKQLVNLGGVPTKVLFRPDSQTVVVGATDGVLAVIDARTGGQQLALRGHRGAILDLDLSPDGRWAVTASSDRTARLWDLEMGRETALFDGLATITPQVAFDRHGELALVAGFVGDGVRAWSRSDEPWRRRIARLATSAPRTLAVSPDGHLVAAVDRDRGLRLRSLDSGRTVTALEPEGGWGQVYALAFSSRGDELLVGGRQRVSRFRLDGTPREEVEPALKSKVVAIAPLPDGGWVEADASGVVAIRGRGGELRGSCEALRGMVHASPILAAPSARLLITLGEASLELRSILDASLLRTIPLPRGGAERVFAMTLDAREEVISVLISNDREDSARIEARRLSDGAEAGSLGSLTYPYGIECAAFAPGGRVLAIGHIDGVVRVLDARRGQEVALLPCASGVPRALTFSPGARSLVLLTSARAEGGLELIDFEARATLAALRGEGGDRRRRAAQEAAQGAHRWSLVDFDASAPEADALELWRARALESLGRDAEAAEVYAAAAARSEGEEAAEAARDASAARERAARRERRLELPEQVSSLLHHNGELLALLRDKRILRIHPGEHRVLGEWPGSALAPQSISAAGDLVLGADHLGIQAWHRASGRPWVLFESQAGSIGAWQVLGEALYLASDREVSRRALRVTRAPLESLFKTEERITGMYACESLIVTLDARRALTAHNLDGSVRWSVPSAKRGLSGMTRRGDVFVTLTKGGEMVLRDIATGAERGRATFGSGYAYAWQDVGEALVIGTTTGQVQVWDWGEEGFTLRFEAQSYEGKGTTAVTAVALEGSTLSVANNREAALRFLSVE